MDGTLYKFKGGSLKDSGFYNVIIENTLLYILKRLKKTRTEARKILDFILGKYGDSISIGLEKEFEINRYDYFGFAWNVDVKDHVRFNSGIKPFLLNIKDNFNLVLLSDAPRIWVNKVLEQLEVGEIFEDCIFSGEGDARKEFGNGFNEIIKTLGVDANECIVVGDQEDTDIIPAKKIGMKTIYVGENKSNIADYSIDNIFALSDIINKL